MKDFDIIDAAIQIGVALFIVISLVRCALA